MTTTTISADAFAREAGRRLIDSFDLMNLLGLRSRQAVWMRVEKGTLPQPVYKTGNLALWDRDSIPA